MDIASALVNAYTMCSVSICTLVNAGYPYALAAVLNPEFDVKPLLLTRDGRCRDEDVQVILSSRVLVTGDLPVDPFAGRAAELRGWLRGGGILIHYTGWKDFKFLREVPDLFAVDVARDQPMLRTGVATRLSGRWESKSWSNMPPAHFLTHAVARDGAHVLIRTENGAPVLVETATGEGRTFLFLTPISFPAGEAWAYWRHYSDLFGELTALPRSDSGVLGDVLALYSDAHRARKDRDFVAAQRGFFDVAVRARAQNVTLSLEASQMVRTVGKESSDPVAVLLGFRAVTAMIGKLSADDETYDYSADQEPWYELRHCFDEINYLGRDPEQSAKRAEECFEILENSPPKVGALDPTYTEGLRHLLRALTVIFDFGRTVEPRASLEKLPAIERELATGSTKTYQHPQAEVFTCALTLLKSYIPFRAGEAASAGVVANARKRLDELTVREFGADVTHLLAMVNSLDDYEDDEAWPHAVRIEQPGLRAVCVGILTLRARLRREPLVVAGAADYAGRERVTRAIARLQGLKNERRGATVRLLLLEGDDMVGSGFVSLPLSLNEADVEEIVKYAPAFELFVFDRHGVCVGALPHDSGAVQMSIPDVGAAQESFLISAASARLAARTRDRGAGITIDATMRTTLFAEGRPIAQTVGTRWTPWNPVPLEILRRERNVAAAAETICRRILGIVEDHFSSFHGGSIILATTRRTAPATGKQLGSGVRLADVSDSDLAALLAVDGTMWLTTNGELRIQNVGCKLPVPRESVAERPEIAGKGTRHRAVTEFALKRNLPALIFSADSTATYVSETAGIARLW